MQKEPLTLKNIKFDLKSEAKNCGIRLLGFSVLFLAVFALTLWTCSLGSIFIIYGVAFGLMATLALFLVVTQILDIFKLNNILKNKTCMVRDKLVGMEIKEHMRRTSIYQTYHLYFSGYGEYVIPSENYKWSSNFSMNEIGVYNYSDCGDEFYLVLSKPHNGKILLVYNSKLFDFQ